MDRGTWWAAVHRAESQTQLSDQHFHFSHSLAQVLERRSDTLTKEQTYRLDFGF